MEKDLRISRQLSPAGPTASARRSLAVLGGAEVTIFDLNEASIKATVSEFAEAGGLSLHGEIVNIAEETDVIACFEAVAARSKGGHLDIMINCAAIFSPTNRRLTDVSTAEFDFETAINLRGTVLIAKHAIVARGRGDEGTRGRGDVGTWGRGDESSISPPSPVRKEARAMNPCSSTKAGVIGLVESVGKNMPTPGPQWTPPLRLSFAPPWWTVFTRIK